MSERKLREILEQLADGEYDVEEAFDEIASAIRDFDEPYEGE